MPTGGVEGRSQLADIEVMILVSRVEAKRQGAVLIRVRDDVQVADGALHIRSDPGEQVREVADVRYERGSRNLGAEYL